MQDSPHIDLNSDRTFQERFWRIQRVAWLLMGAILIAAVAGLTGKGGPLAHASVSGPGGKVIYPRFTRWQGNDQVEIRLSPFASGNFPVKLDRAFLGAFTIQDIQPEPTKSIATADGETLEFELDDRPGEKRIVIRIVPGKPRWVKRASVTLGEAGPLRFSSLVLP